MDIDVAEEIRELIPKAEEVLVEYIAGYIEDADEDEDIIAVTRSFLESPAEGGHEAGLEKLLSRIERYLEEKRIADGKARQPKLTRLDKVVDMSQAPAMSSTIAMSEGVDLSSINKGKASRVDLKKLEKAEAKLKQSYEEMFLKVNSLEARAAGKGKSKDIHLPAIDVTFGSNRILQGASLTLAYGRRYGLIGRNGVGKSTLLRHIAMREVPVPPHITILFVEQEIVGDDTTALESVLKADVWRDRLLKEERSLNERLLKLEEVGGDDRVADEAKEELSTQLADVHTRLAEMEAESGPARAASLLAGLSTEATKTFSGGWRMRLALARALFVKPDLLMLDEPSNHIDLNALAWLEDYLQTWPSTLLVVSHDRAFLDAVATDIVHQHSSRLDYYKGNFTQFYATKTERDRNARKEYETQMAYRAHLQAFIDRWRYNANRAAQAQSKIKILEKLPELEPPEEEETEKFKFPETEKISPPLLQLSEVSFGYSPDNIILRDVNIDIGLESRIAVVELNPMGGQVNRNGRLRVAYFGQHHLETLNPAMSPVAFLASKFPGKSEQEYRQHLGAFGITGLTGLQTIGTLSGGQKSRVAFSILSMQKPHLLLLDEPTNHLDIEGLDALMNALQSWNGGVILISHDERFITTVSNEGDVQAYKLFLLTAFPRRICRTLRCDVPATNCS
ncbi:ATP-dependent transporter [Rhizoctonia solani AG-1 IA]|uniref:ATP-dependent transporter n=1 Tax=Thanatephorus cucumeris (strain AG1-IA) TaxID=983506 RepID=L8X2J2_THACA|nr:ATP-dependent transporter [Rhizoctonia solani AG-1 IA]